MPASDRSASTDTECKQATGRLLTEINDCLINRSPRADTSISFRWLPAVGSKWHARVAMGQLDVGAGEFSVSSGLTEKLNDDAAS